MQKRQKLLAALLATALLQGCSMSMFGGEQAPSRAAAAATPGTIAEKADAPAEDDSFAIYDKDRDGVIVKSELEAGIAAQYKADDTNADGNLDPDEVRAINDRVLKEPQATPVIDWNADGKIQLAEYASQWRTMFDRADVNGDGTVDAEERAGRARARKPRPLPQPEFGNYKGKSSLSSDF